MGTNLATVQAPNVTRIQGDSLADIIQAHRECLQPPRYEPIGKMLNIMLGPDDEAAYMKNKEIRERIARLSQVRGLQLDWGHSGPVMAYARARSGIVFPFGISKPPRAWDPVPVEKHGRKITQSLDDYASGWIAGRDGTRFMILQPVLYIGVWILDNLFTMVGHPDRNGKYPTLLMNPNKSEGHIVYGMLELTTARPPALGSGYVPWKDSAR